MDGSDDHDGEHVLRVTVEAASEVFGDRLRAAFALGSLAHGGFAPLASDVDIALIVDEAGASTAGEIEQVRDLSIARAGTSLAERLSIFWADWPGVHHGPAGPARLPAVDRLDLLDHGRLLYGLDDRTGAQRPGPGVLVVEAAQFALGHFDDAYFARLHDPARLVAAGPRAASKAVLFPMRFLYTLATGRIGYNAQAARWYHEHGARPVLADAAMCWRERGLTDPQRTTALLAEHLRALYAELYATYAQALAATGHDALATELAARLRALSTE